MHDAIDVAIDAGVYVVAAAGNAAAELTEVDDDEFGEEDVGVILAVPCQSHEDLACVSATGPINQADFDRLASYSNFGEDVISVAAPGGDFVGVPFDAADLVLSPCSRSSLAIPSSHRGPR